MFKSKSCKCHFTEVVTPEIHVDDKRKPDKAALHVEDKRKPDKAAFLEACKKEKTEKVIEDLENFFASDASADDCMNITEANVVNAIGVTIEHGDHPSVIERLVGVKFSTSFSDIQYKNKLHGDEVYRYPLLRAADLGHKNTVRVLLERQDCITKHDKEHRNIINHCIIQGWTDLVEELLTCKNDHHESLFNMMDINSKTPFLLACELIQKPIVEMLLQYKDISISDAYDGYIPFIRFCSDNGWSDLYEQFLKRDKKQLVQGDPAPIVEIIWATFCICKKEFWNILIQCSSDILNQYAYFGNDNPVIWAAKKDWKEVVEFFLSNLNVDNDIMQAFDKDGRSILHYCVEKGWLLEMGKVLMLLKSAVEENKCLFRQVSSPKNGGSVPYTASQPSLLNRADKNGKTPILYAASLPKPCHYNAFSVLSKEENIDLFSADNDGHNLLHYCVKNKRVTAFRMVAENDKQGLLLNSQGGREKQTPVMRALISFKGLFFKKAINLHLVDITRIDISGCTIFHYFVDVFSDQYDWREVMNALLNSERTKQLGQKRIMDILDIKDKFGQSPVVRAVTKHHKKCTKYFLQCGVDVSCSFGEKTYKEMCLENGWGDIVA